MERLGLSSCKVLSSDAGSQPGFRCLMQPVCLSALPRTKRLSKGLHFAPTEHLLLGAAEHQPGCSRPLRGLGDLRRLGRLQAGQAGRTQ